MFNPQMIQNTKSHSMNAGGRIKFRPIDGGGQIKEMNRQNKLPQADREFFDFLQSEGAAKQKDAANVNVAIDGSSVIKEMRRRNEMDPEKRRQLEMLEGANSKFRDIDNNAGVGFTGGTYLEKQRYLDSLSKEDRALLDKVQNENSLRPGGVYPFNQKHTPQPFPGLNGGDAFRPNRFTPDNRLRDLALGRDRS